MLFDRIDAVDPSIGGCGSTRIELDHPAVGGNRGAAAERDEGDVITGVMVSPARAA